MAEFFMEIDITPDEEALFVPVGTDEGTGCSIDELVERFEELPDAKSWCHYPVGSTYPYLDRYFTFEFDDEHIFDINWTYVDETNDDPSAVPHWYFSGIRYGTRDEIMEEPGECGPDSEPIADPVPSITGTYIYRVGNDYYSMSIR